MRAAVVGTLACVLLSGCVGAITPSDPPKGAWHTTTSDPWIAVTHSCGFCHGSEFAPEVDTTVVFEDGRVLWFAYSIGNHSYEGAKMKPGLEKFGSEVNEVVDVLNTTVTSWGGIFVHNATSATLGDDDWQPIASHYESAVRRARDPGPPNYGCMDCGGPTVQLFGAKEMVAELHLKRDQYGNYREGDAWGQILEQTNNLRWWIADPTWARAHRGS